MKRKLVSRNKQKWSEVFKLPSLYRAILFNDRCGIKKKKRLSYKRVERFDLAYQVGKKGSIMVPIRIYSLNKKSRIQDKPDGSRFVGSIERFNEIYNLNKKLEDLPKKRFGY